MHDGHRKIRARRKTFVKDICTNRGKEGGATIVDNDAEAYRFRRRMWADTRGCVRRIGPIPIRASREKLVKRLGLMRYLLALIVSN